MRLWSIDPKYLDAKGLVALWRESLLAKKVLSGETKGYKNHPQLIRFNEQSCAMSAINSYLETIYYESVNRGYSFNHKKVSRFFSKTKIEVSKGQLQFEFNHLQKKLKVRDNKKYLENKKVLKLKANSFFYVTNKTQISFWEKTIDNSG